MWALLQWAKRQLEDITFPIRMRLGRKIMWDGKRKIVQTSPWELIKGPCRQQELEAMLYVAARTSVPLARVRRTYHRKDGLYIAMDFVRGKRLDDVWAMLDETGQQNVVERLWRTILGLRAHTPPAGSMLVVGSVDGEAAFDGVFGYPVGPFYDIHDFRSICGRAPVLCQYRDIWDRSDKDEGLQSKLTHADISPRNIIIRQSGGELVLIDWELAGWWPDYWERLKWHFSDFPPTPGWVEMLDRVSQPEGSKKQ